MDIKPILGAAVGLQSVGLLANNMKLLPGYKMIKKKQKKGRKLVKVPKKVSFMKPLVSTGITNLIGIGLIKAQSEAINTL